MDMIEDCRGGRVGPEVEQNVVCEEESIEVEEPKVGMTFGNVEELYEFYKIYARGKGFGISKRGGRKDELTGEQRWLTITCSKGREHKPQGKNIMPTRPSGREGCKARISCVKKVGAWIISRVNLEHNHDIRPEQSRYIRQHRVVDFQKKRQLEINDKAGLRPCQNVKAAVYKAGGHEELPCLSVDLTNHVSKVRRLKVVGGDAEALHSLFGKMQTKSKDFVYVIKPDKEGRLKHVFWADGRCRAAYKDFYDVITFDTTYLVNKYEMPMATFVGVNHHGQSILLGCALLNNEKCKTFIWLFETWLNCMDGQHPEAIITDQCAQIGEAIKRVFPNSRHRWCLWHIVSKFGQKLAGCLEIDTIREAFNMAMYDVVTSEEFEQRWEGMIVEFNLQSNEWLSNMYANRHMWVPIYVKSKFWAGMSTTQRSESIHSFFDGFVHSRTTLTQFAEQYEIAVRDKVEKEMHEDFVSCNYHIPCFSLIAFEKQMRNAYTNNIFRIVQKNLVDIMYCDPTVISRDETKILYEVTEMVSGGTESSHRLRFVVNFESGTHEANCNCQLFEFKGILCPHVFKVFTFNDVTVIPERYILRRWRKDVGRVHSSIKLGCSAMTNEMRRAKELEDVFYAAMSTAVEDSNKYEYLMASLKENNRRIQKWPNQIGRSEGEINVKKKAKIGEQDSGAVETIHLSPEYKDPKIVRRRGRPRMKRHIPAIERFRRKKPRGKRQGGEKRKGTGSSEIQRSPQNAIHEQGRERNSIDAGALSSMVGMCVGDMNYHSQNAWQWQMGIMSRPSSYMWTPYTHAFVGGVNGLLDVQSNPQFMAMEQPRV